MLSKNTHQLQQACCPLPPPGAAAASAPHCSLVSAGIGRLSRMEVAWSRAKPLALAGLHCLHQPRSDAGSTAPLYPPKGVLGQEWDPGRAAASLATEPAAAGLGVTQTLLTPSQLQSQKEPSIYFCF